MICAHLVRALLTALAAFGLVTSALAQGSGSAAPADDRQILVMLNLPPPHFKPGRSYSGTYGDAQAAAARRRIARRIAGENQLQIVESWPMPLLGVDCYVMRVSGGASTDEVMAKVSRNANVAWAQPMQVFETQGTTALNDPLFRAAPAATRWRLADLHRVATGRGARVAVIDSKVEVTHPDLAGQFAAARDFVGKRAQRPEAHGTAVAGVIAAKANNGVGMAGIAPGARLMALRACWEAGSRSPALCNSLSLARALQFAIEHDARVINLSLSGPPDPLLRKLIALAISGGASVVTAFDPKLPGGGFPASQPGVIAVAEESLQPLPRELYGAPGRSVPTTQPGGKWSLVSGSSYAAAHVSGLVALLLERRCSGSTPVVLVRSADGVVDACATLVRVPSCGAGRQNRALACD